MPTITTTHELLDRAIAGERLTLDDGLALLEHASFDELRAAALVA